MKFERLADGTVVAVPDNGNLGFAAMVDNHFGTRFERQLGLQNGDKTPIRATGDSVLAELFQQHVEAVPTPEQPGRQRFVNGIVGIVGVKVAGMPRDLPKEVREVEELGPPVDVYKVVRQTLIAQGVPEYLLNEMMARIRPENWPNFLGSLPPRDYDF